MMLSENSTIIKTKVIPVIRAGKNFDLALSSESPVIFILESTINELFTIDEKCTKISKKCFVHVELLKGLREDKEGLNFLRRFGSIIGVVSTKPGFVELAKSCGFKTILRVFLVDGAVLSNLYDLVKSCKPDFVEILPGILFEETKFLSKVLPVPVITGGLVRTEEQVRKAIEAGALAVSTSSPELWKIA